MRTFFTYIGPWMTALGALLIAVSQIRREKRSDRVDPLTAAGNLTAQMAAVASSMVAPLQAEVKILRMQVLVLERILRNNGIPIPEMTIIEMLAKDLDKNPPDS